MATLNNTAKPAFDNVLTYIVKNVFGEMKLYPGNEQAKRLCAMVGAKTLTRDTMAAARGMGFRFVEVDTIGREVVTLSVAA